MKMERKYKPELIASKDDIRYVLTNLCIDIHKDKTVVVATDGRRLVCVPCEIDSIHEIGLVPVEAIAQARKVKSKNRHDDLTVPLVGQTGMNDRLQLNGRAEIRNGPVLTTIDRPGCEFNYPKWPEAVIPKGEPTFTVSLNAELLLGLAKALGTDGSVKLQFTSDIEQILVTPSGQSDGEFGVLMPLRTH